MSSVVEVWRLPDTGPGVAQPAGGIGVGEFGMAVEGGTNPSRPDQTRAKVAEYWAQIVGGWQGDEKEFGGQVNDVSRYTVFLNAGDNPVIEGGDVLLEKQEAWEDLATVEVGEVRQALTSNGCLYRCSVAGTTGATEPAWPKTTLGQTVVDGTVTWVYIGSMRKFEVKIPGGVVTYEVLRRVLVEEIHT